MHACMYVYTQREREREKETRSNLNRVFERSNFLIFFNHELGHKALQALEFDRLKRQRKKKSADFFFGHKALQALAFDRLKRQGKKKSEYGCARIDEHCRAVSAFFSIDVDECV
jgi:hypothetical protein